MAEIRKLSSELIGKIAAGEVVERPASVVKELVENAIDAGATHVTVELRGGGIEYLRISDNGKGIPAGQIRLAFERHATSKLQTEAELYCIHRWRAASLPTSVRPPRRWAPPSWWRSCSITPPSAESS